MNTPRLVFVVADIHAGSTLGLMPPEFTTGEGVVIQQNPFQKWLWSCWMDSMEWVKKTAGDSPYVIVLNGDLIEGCHHHTKQVISPDVSDHVDCAASILEGFVSKASRTFIIKGTECHTQNSEITLGKILKAERNKQTELPAWDKLYMDICGVRVVVRHHIGTSIRRGLSGTQLSLHLAEEQVEAANSNQTIPRVLCCAHRHKFGLYQDNNGICVVSPPWQGLTRYGHKVVPTAQTNPGIYALDWRGLPDGTLPRVHSIVYESEQPAAVKI